MALIPSVGGIDDQQIAHGQHVAGGGFMRKDPQAGAHVELPDEVATLPVEATELALGGDVVQMVPFHIRRTCRRRQQELPQPALHSRGHVLPEERAIRDPKGHEHAALVLKVGVHAPGVIGTHIDRIAGNHGTAIRVLSQLDAPDDVPPGGRIPVNRRIARRGLPADAGLPVCSTTVWGCGAMEGAGTGGEATGSPDLTPAIRRNAHSASSRSAGSFAASLSASRAVRAFGPMLPSAPAAKMRT